MTDQKKYKALRGEILDYINKMGLKENEKLPTVREIIHTSKYSYTTVNRTLQEMEKEGLITRIQGKGIFVSKVDKSVKDPKQIALILPKDFAHHKILLNILTGVREEVEKHRFSMIISISNMSHEREKTIIDRLIRNHIAGLIIFLEDNYLRDYSHIVELRNRNYPFVLVDRPIPDLATDFVGINNENGMLKVCSYLRYNRHCDSIVFIASNDPSVAAETSNEKYRGYQHAMQVLYGNTGNPSLQLIEFIDNLPTLSSQYGRLGVCLNHDTMYLELQQRLQQQNLTLPDNIILFGYDNSFSTPPFPTVEQFNDEVGRRAAQLLFQKFEHPETPAVQIRLEPRLVLPDAQGNYHIESF